MSCNTEELKSQPVVSPLPASSLAELKTDETTTEDTALKPTLELPTQFDEDSQIEKVQQNVSEEIKTEMKEVKVAESVARYKLGIQQLSTDTDGNSPRSESGGSVKTTVTFSCDILESDERRSSGSDMDSEALMQASGSQNEQESKSLVVKHDSLEEELPYVPTTLPLER